MHHTWVIRKFVILPRGGFTNPNTNRFVTLDQYLVDVSVYHALTTVLVHYLVERSKGRIQKLCRHEKKSFRGTPRTSLIQETQGSWLKSQAGFQGT